MASMTLITACGASASASDEGRATTRSLDAPSREMEMVPDSRDEPASAAVAAGSGGDSSLPAPLDDARVGPSFTEPFPTEQIAPREAEQVRWGFPTASFVGSEGPCEGVTISEVVAVIHKHYDQVAGIDEARFFAPGKPRLERSPSESVPPSDHLSYYVPLVDERSIAFVFFSGKQCKNGECQVAERWYFETDSQCRPRWVGHYKRVKGDGCWLDEGEPVWGNPEELKPRERCDVDLAAQSISGDIPIQLIGAGDTCDGDGKVVQPNRPAILRIAQAPGGSPATATVLGSGLEVLDGVVLSGPVDRQHLLAEWNGTKARECTLDQHIVLELDFENPPSPFRGTLIVSETPTSDCARSEPACLTSLSFAF